MGMDMLNDLQCQLNLGDSPALQIPSDKYTTIPLVYARCREDFAGCAAIQVTDKLDCGRIKMPPVRITGKPPPPTRPYLIKAEAIGAVLKKKRLRN